jgi:hypothetical protein
MFYLNQMGMPRVKQSPQQYADRIDKLYGTRFSGFTNVYQKIKYSNTQLTNDEVTAIKYFYPTFKQQIKAGIPFKRRLSRFLNVYNTMNFYTNPKLT